MRVVFEVSTALFAAERVRFAGDGERELGVRLRADEHVVGALVVAVGE